MHRTTLRNCLALLIAAAVLPAAADDRDLLRDVSAPSNILIILDSSGSMVGTTENGGVSRTPPYAPFAMMPGSGDDPRSRMGVAKRVLQDFLATTTNINFAFAQYSQTLPETNPIFQKHWVYEALGLIQADGTLITDGDGNAIADRFQIVEPGYAFRVGFNVDFDSRALRDPADLATDAMVGQRVAFYDRRFTDPETQTPDPLYEPPETRYGPIGAATLLSDPTLYDVMPVYFGGSPAWVFPSGADPWSYGSWDTTRMEQRFRRCLADTIDADDDGTPDDPDACKATWNVPIAGTLVTQWQRRARVEIVNPAVNPLATVEHHPLAVDQTGTPVGNVELAGRRGVVNYNLDATSPDADLDGNDASDWVMYVEVVEERRSRECDIPSSFPTWTPTASPTATPSLTPTITPTPTPEPCLLDGQGLLGVWYNGGGGSYSEVLEHRDNDQPFYDWGSTGSPLPGFPNVPADNFSVRWTGELRAEQGGTWVFCSRNDDGYRLWVDGNLTIDSFIPQAPTYNCGQVTVPECSNVEIRIDYYENGGNAVSELYWAPPGTAFPGSRPGWNGSAGPPAPWVPVPRENLYQVDSAPPTYTPTATVTPTPTPEPADCSDLRITNRAGTGTRPAPSSTPEQQPDHVGAGDSDPWTGLRGLYALSGAAPALGLVLLGRT